MQKIVPHLWFDKNASEAVKFYTSVFPDSKITNVTTLHDTPSGDTDIVSFEISGYELTAFSPGPFKINPSVSFILNFDPSRDKAASVNLYKLWEKLSEGGTALMPLDKYPFSEKYGWIQDKFGVSWQLMLTDPEGEERPFITPSMMFVHDVAGKSEEAADFYMSFFSKKYESKRGTTARYPAGMEPEKEGSVMFSDFTLFGQWFAAMDSAHPEHKFNFNEAVSYLVRCDTQEEIDYYFEKLSAVPESEQCGWLKDKYGFSWQISPSELEKMITKGSREQVDRLTQAFLPMKKLNIAELKKAYGGK
jgi:predicted 3-demethylubiquinone-9 3-methyltransferase (glyoxalase superfamily)